MTHRYLWIICLGALLLHARALVAQAVKPIVLKPPTATLEAEFVGVTSVREIADGRVIVTDGRDQRLYLADFLGDSASLIGRKGRGPGEWLGVGFALPLAGDSTLIQDFGNGRWIILVGGRIASLVPPDHPAIRAALGSIAGTDHSGHLLLRASDPRDAAKDEFTRADSNALVLLNRRDGSADTIGRTRQRPRRVDRIVGSDGKVRGSASRMTEPNAQEEIAYLFVDGWVAVVRLEPLRVDWRAPNGAWTKGRPFPLRPIAVDAAERKAIERRRAESAAEIRKLGMPPQQYPSLPTSLPVMSTAAILRATSDGRLIVRRSSSTRDPRVRYLVINRRGDIDGEITVGANEDVVGFGPRSVYVVSKNADDIQRLRRHPWP